MDKVYIVLTKTNNFIGKNIRRFTRCSYNHVSISFREDLKEMYSFGRKNINNPFTGRFIVENFNNGILKDENTQCMVYEINVTNEVYRGLYQEIEGFKNNSYNYLGAILVKANVPVARKNKYFCSQFIAYLLQKYNIIEPYKNFNLYLPTDFIKHEELVLVHEGSTNKYRVLEVI